MEDFAFLASLFVILYIIFWSIQNDDLKDQSEQRGLLNLAPPKSDDNTDS